ncbi:MAG: HEAT repeat domain-containing protein, partial [Simkania sp.]|nr:HEAT repeat domain-containing protein [Simkania sp.]
LVQAFHASKGNEDLQSSIVTATGFISGQASFDFLADIAGREAYDPIVRGFACSSLGRLGDPAAIPVLLQAYKSRKVDVRRAAILALGDLNKDVDPKMAKRRDLTLIKALEKESDAQALGFLCITIGKLQSSSASFQLSKTLVKAKQPNIRGFAAIGLGLVGDQKPKDVLRQEFIKEKNWANLGAYLIGMGLARDQDAIPLIVKTLDEGKGDRKLKEYVITSLGLMRSSNTKIHDAIYRMMRENTQFSRLISTCAVSLAMVGDARAIEYMKELSEHGNALVSSNAALTLGDICNSSISNHLMKLYKKSNVSLAKQFYLVAIGKAHENELRRVSLLRYFSINTNYRLRTLTYEHVLKFP